VIARYVHAGPALRPALKAVAFVELSPASGRKELYVVHSAATCLVDKAREDLAADTSTSSLFGDDHLGHEGMKRPVADEPAHANQAACVIPDGADDPASGQSPLKRSRAQSPQPVSS
jgi:hypothetical protein